MTKTELDMTIENGYAAIIAGDMSDEARTMLHNDLLQVQLLTTEMDDSDLYEALYKRTQEIIFAAKLIG